MRLLLPDWDAGGFPPGVETVILGDEDPPAETLAGVEFAVLQPVPVERARRLFAAMPRLRVVQTASAGIDWLPDQLPDGVTLCDAAGVHDATVAEWVVGVLLAIDKALPYFVEAQRAGTWRHRGVEDLDGTDVLVVGHGSIGRALEARLIPFGVTVRGIARRPRDGVAGMDALGELLPGADVVVVLLPLTRETEGVVDAGFLGRMRDGALLVNAARGPIVDTDALLDALRSGRLRAALDVTDPEPLPDGHPLWSAPNLLLTPHVAGVTPAFPGRALAFVREQVRRYVAGEPLANVVEGGY